MPAQIHAREVEVRRQLCKQLRGGSCCEGSGGPVERGLYMWIVDVLEFVQRWWRWRCMLLLAG
jgi:hypothetical protein